MLRNALKKSMPAVFAAWAVLTAASGCDHVQEPWILSSNPLEQERARPAQAGEALRNRLLAVQTDR
jgi:hypothetical protein